MTDDIPENIRAYREAKDKRQTIVNKRLLEGYDRPWLLQRRLRPTVFSDQLPRKMMNEQRRDERARRILHAYMSVPSRSRGYIVREISEFLKISRQRIYQIIKKYGKRDHQHKTPLEKYLGDSSDIRRLAGEKQSPPYGSQKRDNDNLTRS